jgi:hypothetical protein
MSKIEKIFGNKPLTLLDPLESQIQGVATDWYLAAREDQSLDKAEWFLEKVEAAEAAFRKYHPDDYSDEVPSSHEWMDVAALYAWAFHVGLKEKTNDD